MVRQQTFVMCNCDLDLCQTQLRSKELWSGQRFLWRWVHCDIDLGETTLCQGHDTSEPLDLGQLCEILLRSNMTVRGYGQTRILAMCSPWPQPWRYDLGSRSWHTWVTKTTIVWNIQIRQPGKGHSLDKMWIHRQMDNIWTDSQTDRAIPIQSKLCRVGVMTSCCKCILKSLKYYKKKKETKFCNLGSKSFWTNEIASCRIVIPLIKFCKRGGGVCKESPYLSVCPSVCSHLLLLITSYPHVWSWYFTPLLQYWIRMIFHINLVLTQGHNSKVKARVHTYPKSMSGSQLFNTILNLDKIITNDPLKVILPTSSAYIVKICVRAITP